MRRARAAGSTARSLRPTPYGLRTRWTTHQIIGVGLASVSAAALQAPAATAAVLVGASWLGSLLPDADLAGARVYRRTRAERRHLPLRLLGALARLPLRPLTLVAHRGLTHSVLAAAAASVLLGALVSLVAPASAVAAGTGVAVGYLAHIAADACTPSGVPLLAPLSRARRHLLPRAARIPTGSLRESALALVLVVALASATAVLAG